MIFVCAFILLSSSQSHLVDRVVLGNLLFRVQRPKLETLVGAQCGQLILVGVQTAFQNSLIVGWYGGLGLRQFRPVPDVDPPLLCSAARKNRDGTISRFWYSM